MAKKKQTKEKGFYDLPVQYTETELSEMGKELAMQHIKKNKLEKGRKTKMEEMKEVIDTCESAINTISSSINDGTYMTEIECEVKYDGKGNIKEVIRLDTGEIVENIGDPKMNLRPGIDDVEPEKETEPQDETPANVESGEMQEPDKMKMESGEFER